MQFHIDGRFQAVIQREDASWAVHRADPETSARLREAAELAGLEDDDIGGYLDALLEESLEPAA